MTVNKINNIFSTQELLIIDSNIKNQISFLQVDQENNFKSYLVNNGWGLHQELGRLQLGNIYLPNKITKKITKIINNLLNSNFKLDHIVYVEYNKKYGKPSLKPHFDRDNSAVVVDFQLSANTSWNLGVDYDSYKLEDNSALIFNANEHFHWRPIKNFKEDEFVKMLFFRFYNLDNKKSYENLQEFSSSEAVEILLEILSNPTEHKIYEKIKGLSIYDAIKQIEDNQQVNLFDNIKKYENIFTSEELKFFESILDQYDIPKVNNNYINSKDNDGVGIDQALGRLQFKRFENIPDNIREKINSIAKTSFGSELSLSNTVAVEYSGKYGKPNLPPHFDADDNSLIINFQLSSNTSWDIGLNLKLYNLENNCALVFNPNEVIHWRPHKIFTNEEYIKMIFFRFTSFNDKKYLNLRHSMDHPIFKETNLYRDKLGNT